MRDDDGINLQEIHAGALQRREQAGGSLEQDRSIDHETIPQETATREGVTDAEEEQVHVAQNLTPMSGYFIEVWGLPGSPNTESGQSHHREAVVILPRDTP